jgi:hypothetical protein
MRWYEVKEKEVYEYRMKRCLVMIIKACDGSGPVQVITENDDVLWVDPRYLTE